jgi:hypothetical protein
VARFFNEPFASSVIYPASMAAWLFVAFFINSTTQWLSGVSASSVLIVGWAAAFSVLRRIGPSHDLEERVLEFLNHEPSTLNQLSWKTEIEPVVFA